MHYDLTTCTLRKVVKVYIYRYIYIYIGLRTKSLRGTIWIHTPWNLRRRFFFFSSSSSPCSTVHVFLTINPSILASSALRKKKIGFLSSHQCPKHSLGSLLRDGAGRATLALWCHLWICAFIIYRFPCRYQCLVCPESR